MKRTLQILLLLFAFGAKSLACICYPYDELFLESYDNASIVVILEIKQDEVVTFWELPPLDSTETEIVKLLKDKRYEIEVVETFKGNTDSLNILIRESFTSCAGPKLMTGQKYLFFLHSKEECPTEIEYNACTIREVIADDRELFYAYYEFLSPNIFSQKFKEQSFIMDSINQCNKIKTLRELRDKINGTITSYFVGYYFDNDSIIKKDSILNFKGEYIDGKREGNWISTGALSTSYMKEVYRYNIEHKYNHGLYRNGQKTGHWKIYKLYSIKDGWILREEEY